MSSKVLLAPAIRRFLTTVIFISGFASLLSAQRHINTDSLITSLNTNLKADTLRVRILNKTASLLGQNGVPDGIKYAHEASLLALKLGDSLGLADSHYTSGYFARFVRPNSDSAKFFFLRASEIYIRLKKVNRYVDCLTHLSVICKIEYKLQSALEYAFMANEAMEGKGIHTHSMYGFPYEIIGSVYSEKENYRRAEEYYLKALEQYQTQNNSINIIQVKTSLAHNYIQKKNFDKALKIAKEALVLSKKTRSWYSMILSHFWIGYAFHASDNRDSALYYLHTAEKNLKAHQGESWDALEGFIFEKLGEVYLDNDFGKAEHYLLSVINRAPAGIDPSYYHSSEILLAKLYMKIGQYKKSAYYYHKSLMYSDSINHIRNKTSVEDIETRYLAAQKEKENASLKAELIVRQTQAKNRQLQLILAIAVATLAFVIFILQYRSHLLIRKKNILLTEQNQEIQIQNEEIISQHEEISSQADLLQFKNNFLEKQNDKLEEINREKDGLMSIVAHDLRAPLNRAKGLAGLMKTRPMPDGDTIILNKIMDVSNEGLSLIKDILDVNRLDYDKVTAEPTLIVLRKLLNEEIIQPAADFTTKKNIRIINAVDDNLELTSNVSALKRILENILSNAVKFSPPSSSIFIRAAQIDEKVCIGIQDEGPGISSEDQKKMFKKFQRLTAKPTGGESSTGLGLAIVKSLIEKLQGEIRVESDLGVGTEFIIILPKNAPQDWYESDKLWSQYKKA